ncbi:MAG: hypothetical protein ACJASR_002089 [Psychroserpens sp.]|jgi:hypothetical protein
MNKIPNLLRTIGEFQLAEQQKVKHSEVSEKSLGQLVRSVVIESKKMLVEAYLNF